MRFAVLGAGLLGLVGGGALIGGVLGTGACGSCRGDGGAEKKIAGAARAVDPESARGGSGSAGKAGSAGSAVKAGSAGPAAVGGGAGGAATAAPGSAASSPTGAGSGEARDTLAAMAGKPVAGKPVAGGAIAAEALAAGSDERAAIRDAGALSAWSAVLERGRLLERRGQRGAAWGRIGAAAEGNAWLVDETDGAAGLGIRVAGVGGRALEVSPGERVLAWGAWAVDGERRWVWRVDRMVRLGDAAAGASSAAAGPGGPPVPAVPLPGRLLGELSAAPADAVPPSQRTTGSGQVVFRVVASPAKPGDGWTVADEAKGPPTAVVVLPGEAAVRGGLDYLSADERWSLSPGQWYAAPVTAPGKAPRAGELPVLRARAAPARIPTPAPPVPARRR